MEKMTRKMKTLQKAKEKKGEELSDLWRERARLVEIETTSERARTMREERLASILERVQRIDIEMTQIVDDLEVARVEMLMGIDTEFVEESGA